MALNNLGTSYSEVGRRQDALAPAEEAVQLRRAQAAGNPAYLPNLAMALNNLGGSYRRGRAAGRTPSPRPRKPSSSTGSWPPSNPAYLPDLAGALGNLGGSYSEVGRPQEALAPAEEAAQLYREQAAGEPRRLPPRPRPGAGQPRRPLQRGRTRRSAPKRRGGRR